MRHQKTFLSLTLASVLVTAACAAERANEGPSQSEYKASNASAGPASYREAAPSSPAASSVPAKSDNARLSSVGFAGPTQDAVGGGSGAQQQPVSLDQVNGAQTAAEAFNRKIIRNADVTVVIDDTADAQRKLTSIAESQGGFVVTSDSRQGSTGVSPTISVTIRVPAERFGAALEGVRGLGGRVAAEKVTGQDVTEEYIDLQARIRTKQALEAQFLEIMKQARSVSDALEVQREIAGVRTEIEQLEGRRRYLENQSSLSTIVVTLQPDMPVVTATKSGFFDNIKWAFGDAIDTGAAIVTGFIRLLGFAVPITVLIVLPLALLIRYAFRRISRRRFTQMNADQQQSV